MNLLHISLGMHQTAQQLALQKWCDDTGGIYKVIDWTKQRGNTHALNSNILNTCIEFKIDLVYAQLQTQGILYHETADKLRDEGVFIMSWNGDRRSWNENQWMVDLGKHIDLTLMSNMEDVYLLRKEGVISNYQQIGYENTFYTPGPVKKKWPPIIFLGNQYKDRFPLSQQRTDMVNLLKKKYGHRFAVYGNGWPGAKHLNPEDERDCYRGALLFINQDHFLAEKFASDRLLRGMGCGCMALTHYFPGMEEEYTEGTHLRRWKNFDELTELIDFYLENEDLRSTIARHGCQWVQATCTWTSRIELLKSLYEKHKP